MAALCCLLEKFLSDAIYLMGHCGFHRPGPGSDSEAEDIEHAEKLRQVKAVLEEVYI